MNTSVSRSLVRKAIRGRIAVVIVLVLGALVLPGRAEAHGKTNVIALDYEARLVGTELVAPDVRAHILDGDRKLQLTVDTPRTLIVLGYGGESFLRFSARGVDVNLNSPTAVANRITPAQAVPVMSPTAPPKWTFLTRRHQLAWHDDRLGPRPGLGAGIGRVGGWSIPILVDGSPQRIQGGLWRAETPIVWPWLLIGVLSIAVAVAVARFGSNVLRRWVSYVACATCALLVLFVSSGFVFASGRPGPTGWGDLAFPTAIAAVAVAVFLLRAERRDAAAAVVAGMAIAVALGDASVLWHGFVVSALPAQIVRLGVALALSAGVLALIVSAAEFWRGEPEQERHPKPRRQLHMAIPKGKAR